MATVSSGARYARASGSGLRHGAPKNGERYAKKPAKAKKSSTKAPKAPKQGKKRGKVLFVVIVLVLFLGIGATVGFVAYNNYIADKKAQPFRFSENITVSGIDISSLSFDAAREKLEEKSMTLVENFKLNVKAGDTEKTFTKDDFAYKFNYDEPLEAAKVYSLKEQGIYEEPTGTEATVYTEPVTNAKGVAEFELEYELDEKSVGKSVNRFAKKVDYSAKDAEISKFHPFSDERFEYKKSQAGRKLDKADLKEQLLVALGSGDKTADITAKVKKLKPKTSVAFLKKNVVGLSHATSISYNTTDGTNNMALALDACNGSVIKPGEVWSFNDCTGDSNLESNGYRASTVIVDGEYTQGVGGGICQASTVLYQAAILGNVEIYERHYHYYTSSYALSGEDATIDYPNLDLKLRNTTDYPIFIECKVDGTTLIANIYGYQDPGYDNVKMYSENYDITSSNYKTKTYRVLYLNGKEISKEVVNYSTYSLSGGHYVKEADTDGTFRTKPDGTTHTEEEETSPPEETTEAAPEEDETDAPAEYVEETEEYVPEEPEYVEPEYTEDNGIAED